MMDESADKFMILDMDSGNSVASFDDYSMAENAFRGIVHEYPSERDNLALVSFDKSGFALDTELAADLLPA